MLLEMATAVALFWEIEVRLRPRGHFAVRHWEAHRCRAIGNGVVQANKGGQQRQIEVGIWMDGEVALLLNGLAAEWIVAETDSRMERVPARGAGEAVRNVRR